MEKQKVKISKFSKVVRIPISIAFVALIVVGVMQVLSWVVITWNLPYIFKLGEIRVVLPVIITESITSGIANGIIPEATVVGIIQTVVTIVILSLAKRFLRLLEKDGTPFRPDVVKALRKMAITLVVLGIISGMTGWVAAGVAYVLYLIFEYGCTLQKESDTTL